MKGLCKGLQKIYDDLDDVLFFCQQSIETASLSTRPESSSDRGELLALIPFQLLISNSQAATVVTIADSRASPLPNR